MLSRNHLPMTEYTLPNAEVQAKPRFSLIWLIPIIAALICAWLAYTYYSERGTIISVTFDQASGIEARKTPVKYKDVEVGMVQKVSLSSDLKTVVAEIEIYNEMEDNIGPQSQFWVVSPRVTLRGISGLQTLLSGVNIAMDPGPKGRALDTYAGLIRPPTISIQSPGQAFVLSSERLGSVDIGSPVYYSQIEVGEVTGYRLNPDSKMVDVDIFIHAPYHEEIRTNTRFWNASGFEVNVSTSGISARLESLASFLIGGVAFETNFNEPGYPVETKAAFKLYDNYKLAHEDTSSENKLLYTMYFEDSLFGLSEGSPINYKGVKVGQVENISLLKNKENDGIRSEVEAALYVDKLSSNASRTDAERLLQSLVEQGMRAQLVASSIVTGAKYISLTLEGHKKHRVQNLASLNEDYAIIFPSIRQKQSIMTFDPSSIVTELNNTLRTANTLIGSDDTKAMLKSLASTSESISKITAQLEAQGISGEVMTLMKEASKTAAGLQLALVDARKTMGTVDTVAQVLQQDTSKALIDARVMMQSAGKAATSLSGSVGVLQKDTSRALIDVRTLMQTANKATGSISGNIDTLQKDTSKTLVDARTLLRSANTATNSVAGNIDTLQKDTSKAIIDARVMMQKVGKSIETLQKDTSQTLLSINKATGTVERSINATLSEDSALQYRFQQLINDLSEAASSFSVLADTLQRKPNSLILGK
ncbi:MCE family protein [Leucothrix sargassi]|nr:MCE family protein [Leucothrix sargassi]